MEDINENTKNLYVIKRRLAELKKRPGYNDFVYYVGRFALHMYTNSIQDPASLDPDDTVVKYDKLDVSLHEISKNGIDTIVGLSSDPRFREYRPIIYNFFESPNGLVNLGDGREMPLTYVCELVKYLHRLSKLTAFA
jgi:hypothetical protein